MDSVLAALGVDERVCIVDRLCDEGPLSMSQLLSVLEENATYHSPAYQRMHRHLKALREVGLVVFEDGRYGMVRERIAELRQWLGRWL
jgi:DNA-binding transcriptional ArsR family regulator